MHREELSGLPEDEQESMARLCIQMLVSRHTRRKYSITYIDVDLIQSRELLCPSGVKDLELKRSKCKWDSMKD